MAAEEVQRLDLKDLDAVLARAEAEGWTELALLARGPAVAYSSGLRNSSWTATRVFLLGQPLQTVPEALNRLTDLGALDMGGNQIGDAGAEALAHLEGLGELKLQDTGIGDAGAEALTRLTRLTALDLANNQISASGAEALARLTRLNWLDLADNEIGDAGAEALASTTWLTSLNLFNNWIGDSGAKALARLTGLNSLNLEGNHVGDAGAEALAHITGLTALDLSNNRIGNVGAEALSHLACLESLSLWGNQIGDAGAVALGHLAGLTSLNLWGNLIGDVGARAILDAWTDPASAERRRFLNLGGNMDLGGLLPAEVLEQTDAQALIAFWRRFREAEAKGELRPLDEAKVLVLGEPAVGKTSLVRFLVEGLPRVEGEPKTGGIVIKPDVEIANWSAHQSAIRLHFWDFGGQEIMHHTHRYFLTRRSLYLVILDDRREDERSVYDWLKVIRSRGGESPVLVVINKCDTGTPNLRLDETGIRAAYPNVVGFVAVSCNPGSEERIAGLRQRIAEIVVADARLKHVRDPFPPEQLRVKQAVAATAAEAQYLERAAFVRLCENAAEPDQRITDPALQRSLLQLLHDLGTVVAHGLERERSDAAREVTLLDPNWLTEAIYQLLNSKHILDNSGEFDAGDMERELDPERYPPERHGYIVDMMQEPEIGLCFRLPGQGEPRWLMPECLPSNEPEVARFFDGALRFRYTYELLPRGLLPRFIVEAYNKFTDHPTRWRAGAILEVDGCTVLVRGDRDKQRIDLAVTGPEGRRRSALAAVRHDLDVVHKLNPEIGTEARVPLPDDPEVDVGYEHLLELEADEGASHSWRPEKAARKYTVRELLDGVREAGSRRAMAELEPTPLPNPQPVPPSRPVEWADYNLWALGSGIIVGLAAGLATWALGLQPMLSLACGLASAFVIGQYVRSRNPDTVLPRLLTIFSLVGAALFYHSMGPRLEITLPDALGGGSAAFGSSEAFWPLVIWLAAFALLLVAYLLHHKLKSHAKP